MKQILQKYRHAWVLLYVFLYIPWFFYLERTVTSHYHIIHVALDDYIPFNEYFIIPYLFWFLYVAGTVMYFFFKDKHDFYRLCAFLFTGMTISLIICTFYPNGTDFRPAVDPDKNIFCALVAMIQRADTCTNVLPSIHVYNSIGVHISIMNSERLSQKRWLHRASFFAMTAICLSTVFLKAALRHRRAGFHHHGLLPLRRDLRAVYESSRRRAAEKVAES